MEQNEITSELMGKFEDAGSSIPKTEIDEVERLINERYQWQLNDVSRLYDGGRYTASLEGEEKTRSIESDRFLAWLADKPQRIYGGESLLDFASLTESYSTTNNLWNLLRVFYEDGEYEDMVKKLMKYEDRATEIPLIIVVGSQDKDERAVHGEIRKVWFEKLNKEKSVIVLVIDKSKLLAMEQEE